MDISIQDITEIRKSIVVSLDETDALELEEKVNKEFIKNVHIPGFRKGKSPLSIIKNKFSDKIKEEKDKKLEEKCFKFIQESNKFKIYSIIKKEKFYQPNIGMTFIVDLWPKINLFDYKKIDLNITEQQITQQDIDHEIELIRKNYSKIEKVDRSALLNDYVRLSYTGKINGESVDLFLKKGNIYATQKNTWEKAGAIEEFGIKEIVQALVGMKSNDKKIITVSFPPEFLVSSLAEKDAIYEIEVHEIREQKLPELNEEFFKIFKEKNITGFQEMVKKQLIYKQSISLNNNKRQQIANFIDKETNFHIPESALEEEIIKIKSIAVKDNIKKEEIIKNINNIAKTNCKVYFFLSEVAHKENIQIKEDDIRKKIIQMSYQQNIDPKQIIEEINKNKRFIEDLKQEILVTKTLDFLSENANVCS